MRGGRTGEQAHHARAVALPQPAVEAVVLQQRPGAAGAVVQEDAPRGSRSRAQRGLNGAEEAVAHHLDLREDRATDPGPGGGGAGQHQLAGQVWDLSCTDKSSPVLGCRLIWKRADMQQKSDIRSQDEAAAIGMRGW